MPGVDKKQLEELFAPFLADNAYSKIEQIPLGDKKQWAIQRPWNDESLAFAIPDDPKQFAKTLNDIVLPQRFSAIWHKKTKDFEVIFTAFHLGPLSQDFGDRKFKFDFGDRNYVCEFGDSSQALLSIAKESRRVSGTQTGYRNLSSFEMYVTDQENFKSLLDKPRSFWIRDVECDEDRLVDLAYHINFYMSYFDDKTSKIIIHPTPTVSTVKPQNRYIAGKFPQHITAKAIDPNILQFWGAAHGADDPAKSFLYYYRLIEYTSASFIESEARAAVRRLLAQPNVLDDISALTESLVLAIQTTKKDDEQRIVKLLEDTLQIKDLWPEIEKNIGSFTKPTKFEGGFTLEPLLTDKKMDGFEIGKFAKHTKDIRNALSHGRDIRTQQVIIPTRRNFDLLQPWVILMSIVAGQVVLYKSVS